MQIHCRFFFPSNTQWMNMDAKWRINDCLQRGIRKEKNIIPSCKMILPNILTRDYLVGCLTSFSVALSLLKAQETNKILLENVTARERLWHYGSSDYWPGWKVKWGRALYQRDFKELALLDSESGCSCVIDALKVNADGSMGYRAALVEPCHKWKCFKRADGDMVVWVSKI